MSTAYSSDEYTHDTKRRTTILEPVPVASAPITPATLHSDANPPLHEMFCYGHVRRPLTCWRLLLLVCYFPIGVTLLCIRLWMALCFAVVLIFLPSSFLLPPRLARLLGLLFGMVVTHSGLHDQLDRETSTPTASAGPIIIAANHRCAFDVFPFLFLHRVRVLIDSGFYAAVSATFQKVVGAIPIDQSKKQQIEERERMRQQILDFIGSSEARERRVPLLFFPEGWDTNGKAGILRYNQFLFSLNKPILPAAITVRIPLMPLEPGVLGVQLITEILWLLFAPFTVWHISFLPLQKRGGGETAAQFARRVQELTAKELGIVATTYSNQDALRFRLALMTKPGLRDTYLTPRSATAVLSGQHLK